MTNYYVNNNAQNDGCHEIHREGCVCLQKIVSKTDLGLHNTCESALVKARKYFAYVNGCANC